MLNGSVLTLAAYLVLQHPFALPPSATVNVGSKFYETTNENKIFCESYKLSPTQVRRMFRTYHELHAGEMHDHYLYAACGIRGTVKVNGQVFHWESDPGNTMRTDYPDGTLRTLGGKYTDDMGAGEARDAQ